jgi:hypothetical protein
VGQVVAWRELSWGLRQGLLDSERSVPRWRALGWLLERTGFDRQHDSGRLTAAEVTPAEMEATEEHARRLAREGAGAWRRETTVSILVSLAGT